MENLTPPTPVVIAGRLGGGWHGSSGLDPFGVSARSRYVAVRAQGPVTGAHQSVIYGDVVG